ncbi:MAG: hypothetical protein IKZ98_08255 [Clostridia bacterium]|nr:hypothetical protein [Clostridia bacterium]
MKGAFTIAPTWQENKLNLEKAKQAQQKEEAFRSNPLIDRRVNVSPFHRFSRNMAGRYLQVTVRASDILPVVAIAFIWAANYLNSEKRHITLIPITNNFVIDSLIPTAIICIIWFFIRRRQRSYDDIAAEIESKYTENDQR